MIFDKENKIITLNNVNISLIHTIDDNIYIKAQDLLMALEYDKDNHFKILKNNLKKYETKDIKFLIDFKTLKNKYKNEILFTEHPQTLFINEEGIYEFLFNSNKKEAQEFRKWVFKVLQSIRKDGVYIRNQETDKTIKKLQEEVNVLLCKIENQENKIENQENKIIKLSTDKNKFSNNYNLIKDKFEIINTKIITSVEDGKMPTITICDLKSIVMDKFKFYVIRCQKRSLKNRLKKLIDKFPLLEVLKIFNDPNSFTTFNFIKQYEDADFRYNYISIKNNSSITTFIQYIKTVRYQIESLPTFNN